MATLREIDVKYRFKEVECNIIGQSVTEPDVVAKLFDYLKHETKEPVSYYTSDAADE